MSKKIALWILIVPALLLATALPPKTVTAEGLQTRIQTDLEYIYSDIDRDVKATGESTKTNFSYFKQKYDLDFQNQLYPYLKIHGGGAYELVDSASDTDGSKSGFKETTTRLFGELDFTNPLYAAGGAYRYREFKFNPRDFDTTKMLREEYSGLWRWRPVGFPAIDLDFSQFRTSDGDNTRDLVFDRLVLKGRYNYRDFSSDYTYTRSDRDDRIAHEGLLTQVHNSGVRYATDIFRDRLELNTAARLDYALVEPSGTGDVQLPTSSPGAPFYLLDDSDPGSLTVVDTEHPLATVNIVQDGPINPVAVGLDFGPPTEIDTIHILPLENASDPTVASPGEIAAVAEGFTWTVFISDDQQNWDELKEQEVTSQYNIFDNRFEISFPGVETQFIKVVTTPLTNASAEIRIAGIRAFTNSAGVPGRKRKTFTQTYNLGLRWAVRKRTTATYEFFATIRDDYFLDTSKTTLTNAISVQNEFSPMFYGNARVLRTDADNSEGPDTVRHTYTASIIGDYLPTLQQRLVYSGTYEKEGGDSGYVDSIFLRTNADIYRDWSVNLDVGYASNRPAIGPDNTSTTVRLSTNIAPDQRINITIDYRGSWDNETGRPSSFNQIAKFQAFCVPVRTLSLFAGIDLRDDQRSGEGLNVIQNYSITWAPIPDGTLDLSLAYNQRIDMRGTESKILSPEINWQITRKTLLTITFNYGTLETETDRRDVKSVRVNFRLFY